MKNFYQKLSYKKKINFLFPLIVGADSSSNLFKFGLKTIRKVFKKSSAPWIPQIKGQKREIPDSIPEEGMTPEIVISSIIKDFFVGAPNWRSPELQYNICAPVNAASQAVLSLSQEINIHNINNDFSGNCLMAEKLVSEMMADLIDLPREKVRALFSFGGTASNMYAMKLAINNAIPSAGKTGVPSNAYVMITEKAHFSHKTVADWLGIGVDRVIQIKADEESRSMVKDAELKARAIIEKGGIIIAFSLNGGPFYDFAVDDIKAFVDLRSKLMTDYKLSFTPHIHVDSVICWIWLMFNGYDFANNPLKIPEEIIPTLSEQFNRIKEIKLADSWGVDFHKGLGGCPTPCGLFVSNNKEELLLLSKSKRGIDTHHLGNDWSFDDPSDITLETSRSAGLPLTALTSLLTMGKNGFRTFLANQIFATKIFRDLVKQSNHFIVGNEKALGFNTMILIAPEGIKKPNWDSFLSMVENDEQLLVNANEKIKSFYNWALKENNGINRLGCSFSRSFYNTKSGKTVSGLKYCFVSPHINNEIVNKEVEKLEKQFVKFYESRKS